MPEEIAPNPLRRKLIFGGVAAAITTALGGAAIWGSHDNSHPDDQDPTRTPQPIPTPIEVKLPESEGDEMDLSLKKFGLENTPDVHISYATLPQQDVKRYFLSGNGGNTYILDGQIADSLPTTISKSPNKYLPLVWGSEKFEDKRYGYSAIGSVLQTDQNDPDHLTAFTHNEQHHGNTPTSTFTASISQLESFDGGKSWRQVGDSPVIKGDDPMEPGSDVSGAGQPCAIIKDNEVYLFYTDWSRKNSLHRDQIYLAKAKIENGIPTDFKFYKGNGFESGEYDLKSVITPPKTDSNYAALPSISFNNALGKYICAYETDKGVEAATSADLLSFDHIKTLKTYKTPHSKITHGSQRESYPTLISMDQPSDSTTSSELQLLFASGDPHNLKLQKVII